MNYRPCDICGAPTNADSCHGYTIQAEPAALMRYAGNRHIRTFPCRPWLLAVCLEHTVDEILHAGFLPLEMVDGMGNLRQMLNQRRTAGTIGDGAEAA